MKTNWVSVTAKKKPMPGTRVLARYDGVYGPLVVTCWLNGGEYRFGTQPATHWCPIPK